MLVMKKRTHWAWKIYLTFFSLGAIFNFILLISGESSSSQYYKILIAFRHSYVLHYYLSISNTLVDLLCLIPLFLFVFHIRLFRPLLWQILFWTRIAFFFSGHAYEWQTIRSFLYTDSLSTILASVLLILFITPSYIACFHYAFRQKKLFSQESQ